MSLLVAAASFLPTSSAAAISNQLLPHHGPASTPPRQGSLTHLLIQSQLSLNSGPAINTFLVPVALFSICVGGSARGKVFSAARGKCGAVLASFGFGSVGDTLGLSGGLDLFVGVMALADFQLWIHEVGTLEEIERGVMYGVWGLSESGLPPESVTNCSASVLPTL
jgi:hypothetical protein